MNSNHPAPLPSDVAGPLERLAGRMGAIGQRVLWYPEITSTNDVAVALADAGADEGLVVAADAQTAGRGRLGRVWASPPGAGIYASVVLRPAPQVGPFVTLAAGVALADGIEAATGLRARVKWPNDLLVEGTERKLAGILAEAGSGGGASWVVLGFGVNVLPAAYPPEVAPRAASLESELGRPVDRGLVFAWCLAALAERYDDLRDGRRDRVIAAWRDRAASTFGRQVEWDDEGARQSGVAHDIDASGALLVRTPAGLTRIIAGDVRWI